LAISFASDVSMKISAQSTASPHLGEGQPRALTGRGATKEKLSFSALWAGRFGKFDIGTRARLLGRLLASVGPLALTVVGGGVFAKYVRHARSREIPVTFDDAAHATSSQVCDLVHYVEQSNPRLVEELSTTLSSNGARRYSDQTPLETQTPSRRMASQQTLTHGAPDILRSAPARGLGFHWRAVDDY
jgi:hypothetical protein